MHKLGHAITSCWVASVFALLGPTLAKCICRMRVQEVNFKRIPTASELQTGNANGPIPKGLPGNPFAPLEIVANITEDGLGLEAWWGEGEAVSEEP